jgi:hypothetical protein
MLASSGRARTADEYMQFFQAQSLIERGSTAVPQALEFNNLYGRIDLHGQPRTPYPPGQALLSIPTLLIAKLLLTHLPGVTQTRSTIFYVELFGAVLSSALAAAGAMALFFLTLIRLGTSSLNAFLMSLCVSFGTLLFPYSGYFFSEPFTTLVLMAAIFFIARPSAGQPTSRAIVVAGLLLAFAIWIRPTLVLATPVFVIALLLRERFAGIRPALIMCVFPAASALAYLVRNTILFGSPFEFGYPKVEEFGKALNSFHTPFYVGLEGFLISPGKSIFIYLPLLILALFGLRRLWNRDRAVATLAAGLPLLYLLFYMRYTQWEGGNCPGPRYLLPFLIVTCLCLGPVLESGRPWTRRCLLVLAICGFAVQVITYSTSFFEDQSVGTSGPAYYDPGFNYRMSYDPLISQTKRLVAYAEGKPAPIGLGFDRWFVFLHKAGVAWSTEALIAAVPALLLVLSILRLRRLVTQERQRSIALVQA